MIRINLLPHRELRRAAQLRQFTSMLVAAAIAGLVIIVLGYFALITRIDLQERRNHYLDAEIQKLDSQIADIKKLKQQSKELIARKQVVETLQLDRADDVHLLDQLVRLMPEGVYLKSIEQKGNQVHLTGYAQSSARVSTLMRSLDSSPWLHDATLIEVKSVSVQGIQANEFSMDVQMVTESEKANADAGGAKPQMPAGKAP